jgi:alkanesulfonate monooxygenase SsuD/methylene tetrahydromethanopterin reductase-like flavin-dependent oxidoreductase (luciferase family)
MLVRVIAVGVQTWGSDVAALCRYWKRADELGYARITYGDGLWPWTHDGWTMLGALAAATHTVRIGPAVTYAFDPSSHHPSWLAKRAVAVDHLSGGRLDVRVGIGAEDVATAAFWQSHGILYPSWAERVALVDESLEVMRALFTGERVTHTGRRYALRNARLHPRSLQRPAPPIWVAASGAAALDVIARRADGWEASYLAPETFRRRWELLAARLAREGRDPGAIRRSVELDVVLGASPAAAERDFRAFCGSRRIGPGHPLLGATLAGTRDAVLERIAAYQAAGATDLMLGFADFPATEMLERFAADVLPAL